MAKENRLTAPLPNVWMGVSDEGDRHERIGILRETPAAVRFISFEPLICDPGTVSLDGISWAIIGGESGKNHRLCELSWITEIANQCREAGVAVFVKQDSGLHSGAQGRIPDNIWAMKEWPK